MPITLSIGDYVMKVVFHNRNHCYIGEFVGTSKFPTVYGDNIREVEETAHEYVMEAQNELRNN